eukprot:CAMPEP_0119067064 /NCGR_PEP_ID=MMETSP1178-20130426/9426_1 /TAXON_ID=33656 /ORGANISM="unid sp, Strain CCMP2000" /LENGTH=128 /DNA_ID=CAMNT_0007048699 /DNA_START=250 /DNA_END=635 /DNA_ORIENTATION=+
MARLEIKYPKLASLEKVELGFRHHRARDARNIEGGLVLEILRSRPPTCRVMMVDPDLEVELKGAQSPSGPARSSSQLRPIVDMEDFLVQTRISEQPTPAKAAPPASPGRSGTKYPCHGSGGTAKASMA